MDKEKNLIISIGLTGFPYSMAPSQKLLLMGKAAIEGGFRFLVLCNTFIKRTKLNYSLKNCGYTEGLLYATTSPSVFTPNSFLKKVTHKLIGILYEFYLINKYLSKKELNCVFIYSKSSLYCLFWGTYLKLFKVPVYLIYFELVSSLKYRKSFFLKLNDFYFDRYIFGCFSGIITISEKLISHIRTRYQKKKYIKIPPLVNFNEFLNTHRNPQEHFFLYCGTLSYSEVAEFIIDSYYNIKNNKGYKLYLVLNGSSLALNKIKKKITELNLDGNIKILSDLTYERLINLYINSYALLIPLRDSPQDTARFPQKVAEYCASKRPIITTRYGELPNYFDDNSVLFAEKYDIDEFSRIMQFAIENPEKCEELAKNSYLIGKEKFDYMSFKEPLISFIKS